MSKGHMVWSMLNTWGRCDVVFDSLLYDVCSQTMQHIPIIGRELLRVTRGTPLANSVRHFQRFSHMHDALNVPGTFTLGAISNALSINCLLLTDRSAPRSLLRNYVSFVITGIMYKLMSSLQPCVSTISSSHA